MDQNSKISKYFKLYEIAKSNTATRMGIDNTPSPVVIERAQHHALTVLDPLREEFGPLSPQSWFRCEELERLLTWNSGFKNWCDRRNVVYGNDSWADYYARKSHPKGEGTDVEFPHVDNEALYAWIEAYIPAFDQLILECHTKGDPNSGWVHVSSRAEGNRREAFEL